MYRSSFAFALAMAALAAILLPSTLTAQITFQRTYGGTNEDCAYSVEQTLDGGYVAVGYTASLGSGGYDVYLIKTDVQGTPLWVKAFGGPLNDYGRSVAQTRDGGYVIAGYTESAGAGAEDVYLIRTDSAGDTLWTQTYGGTGDDRGYSVQQTSDGGYIVAGFTNSYGRQYDVYLMKAYASGYVQWMRTFGHRFDDLGYSVQQTTDGGFVVAGWADSSSGGEWERDLYLVKTDAGGDPVLTVALGGRDRDEAYAVQQTADGGYALAGWTWSFGANAQVYLVKTDAAGDTLWTRGFGGPHDEWGRSLMQIADNGYVIAGFTRSYGAGAKDIYLVKTDADGETLWTRTFGGTGDDDGQSVRRTADGGYVIAGFTNSFGAGNNDVYLVKTDSLGNVAVAEPKASPTRTSGLTIACQPNPATGAATVRLSPIALRYSPLTLRMYDSQGRVVLTRDVSTLSFPLSTSDFPSGAYFLRLDAGGRHATTRLVLQR